MAHISENEWMEIVLTNGKLEDLISYLNDDIKKQQNRNRIFIIIS